MTQLWLNIFTSPDRHVQTASLTTQHVTEFGGASTLNSIHQICSAYTIYLHRHISSLCKLWVLASCETEEKLFQVPYYRTYFMYMGNPIINRTSGNSCIGSGIFWPSQNFIKLFCIWSQHIREQGDSVPVSRTLRDISFTLRHLIN